MGFVPSDGLDGRVSSAWLAPRILSAWKVDMRPGHGVEPLRTERYGCDAARFCCTSQDTRSTAPRRRSNRPRTSPSYVPVTGLQLQRCAQLTGSETPQVRLKIDVDRTVDSIRATFESTSQRIGQVGQVRRVITAGHRWCPRQDSNLRSRLRRPVDVVIADAFWRPTWASCSRLVSLVASRVPWFDPRDIPRRTS